MKFLIFYLFIVMYLAFPLTSFSHGGVQNSSGDITATFFIDPLVPVVNKKTKISFFLTDKKSNDRLANTQGVLTITESQDSIEEHDKLIFKQNVKSDINGEIDLAYTFPNTKYYDIELSFPNTAREDEIGFLIQPKEEINFYIFLIIVAFLFGFSIRQKIKI